MSANVRAECRENKDNKVATDNNTMMRDLTEPDLTGFLFVVGVVMAWAVGVGVGRVHRKLPYRES